jgi:hypothetical protein
MNTPAPIACRLCGSGRGHGVACPGCGRPAAVDDEAAAVSLALMNASIARANEHMRREREEQAQRATRYRALGR